MAVAVILLGAALAACGDDGPIVGPPPEPASTDSVATVAATAATVSSSVPDAGDVDVTEPALREELLAMMEQDQAEMMGEVATDDSSARMDRLEEIFDEYGWPTIDLVGEDGSTAAWVIAQHADLRPALQQRALELLRPAAEAGQASRGDLAYLDDRVAVAEGREQTYGTQIRCGPDGPEPATPIADEAGVESRREEAGLDPLAAYIDEMTELCGTGTG